jgi:flagellar biosynthesis protein FlhF
MSQARIFRGATLEELLPQIRAELGPDALVTRRREGVVGGIGGFFGRRCLEVEAVATTEATDHEPAHREPVEQDATEQLRELVPAGRIDYYDTGDELQLAATASHSPTVFAGRLAEVFDRFELPIDGSTSLRASLDAAGVPAGIVDAVVTEAEHQLAPFAPDEPLAEHGRRALARRIRVRHAGRGRRRVVALVGASRAGRTSVAIALCRAYASAGTRVAALSLEGVRQVLELAQATDFETALEVADTPEALALVQQKLKGAELVVVDTPPVDPSEPAMTQRLGDLLATLTPTETHLVVRSDTVSCARATLEQLHGGGVRPDRLVIACVDGLDAGRAVAMALAERLPVSYVHGPHGLAPAEPDELARLVIR